MATSLTSNGFQQQQQQLNKAAKYALKPSKVNNNSVLSSLSGTTGLQQQRAALAQLSRVVGCSSPNNNSISYSSGTHSTIIAYPAGCLVVLFDVIKLQQIGFLQTKSNKTVSCVRFSDNGKLLAVGETGHLPSVTIWELSSSHSMPLTTPASAIGSSPLFMAVAELHHHKFGVAAVAFSPSGKYLVSVGVQHDATIALWDWRSCSSSSSPVAVAKIPQLKINSLVFPDETHFLTAGASRHLKFWTISTKSTTGTASTTTLDSKSPILGSLQSSCNSFTDVLAIPLEQSIGSDTSSSSSQQQLFQYVALTGSGIIVSLGTNRMLQRWVQLTPPSTSTTTANNSSNNSSFPSYSLSLLGERYLACASSEATVRLLNPKTLDYIATLPRPLFYQQNSHRTSSMSYPDCQQVLLLPNGSFETGPGHIVCGYGDHSIAIFEPIASSWQSQQPQQQRKSLFRCKYFAASHASCIWDLDVSIAFCIFPFFIPTTKSHHRSAQVRETMQTV